jgi:hypothetical protein
LPPRTGIRGQAMSGPFAAGVFRAAQTRGATAPQLIGCSSGRFGALWFGAGLGNEVALFGDRTRLDKPLPLAGTTGLLDFDAGEAANADETANFGAGGIKVRSSLPRGEPFFIA